MLPRFHIVYVETPSLAELIERYQGAHRRAMELRETQRKLRNELMRRCCESVVHQSGILRARETVAAAAKRACRCLSPTTEPLRWRQSRVTLDLGLSQPSP